jgi:hypothetical protein
LGNTLKKLPLSLFVCDYLLLKLWSNNNRGHDTQSASTKWIPWDAGGKSNSLAGTSGTAVNPSSVHQVVPSELEFPLMGLML